MENETLAPLLDAIRRFVNERLIPLEAKVSEDDAIPADALAEMRALGLFGLSIPEDYGGLGLSMEEECRVMFEFCRCSPAFRSAFGTNVGIGSQGLVMFGTEAQKEKWLPGVASGEIVTSFALTEPEAGSDSASVRTKAELRGDRPRLRQRRGDVVTVTHEDEFLPACLAADFGHGEEIGQRLAGMTRIGQAVDDVRARVLDKIIDQLLGKCPQHDDIVVAAEDAGRTAWPELATSATLASAQVATHTVMCFMTDSSGPVEARLDLPPGRLNIKPFLSSGCHKVSRGDGPESAVFSGRRPAPNSPPPPDLARISAGPDPESLDFSARTAAGTNSTSFGAAAKSTTTFLVIIDYDLW